MVHKVAPVLLQVNPLPCKEHYQLIGKNSNLLRNQEMKLIQYSFSLSSISLVILLSSINAVAAEEIGDRSKLLSTSAGDLLTQPEVKNQKIVQNLKQADLTRVTGVEVNQTNQGLEVILKTAAGSQRLVPLILPEGNKLAIDLLDATLAFAIRNGITRVNPAPGIKSVALTKIDTSSIRLTITGDTQAPSAEIIPNNQNLILSVNPQGNTAQQTPDEEIEVIATGEGETDTDNYYVPKASSATRTDTPIRDIPQSIQVIPQEILEDQQVNRLDEALSNVSGTTFGGTFGNTSLNFNIRGFENAPVLLDGFRQFGTFDNGASETTSLERVEVLKGPASILYGEVQPGGVINLVSKQPLAQPSYQAELQLGNREFVEPSIDFSAPITEDGKVRYRLNALYHHDDGFVDFEQDFKRFFIAPIVSWQLGDNTNLTFQLQYSDEKAPLENGLVAAGNGIVENVPDNRNISEPDDFTEKQRLNLGYDLEHRFSKNWQIRNAFRYSDRNLEDFSALPFEFDENTGIITRFLGSRTTDIQNYSLQTNVVGEFTTGAIAHTLLMGIDLNRTDEAEKTKVDFTPQPLNIFNPVYDQIIEANFSAIPASPNTDTQTDRLGIYLQDQVAFTKQIKLLAGLRYDTVKKNITDNSTQSETNQNDDAVTPRVGMVYQPIPELSLYGSYSQSFTPSAETTSNGDPLKPEKGEGFEFGVKSELLEKKLSATLAYFNITKQNVATPNSNNPLFSVATGEQQSQGIEFDLSGEILPGWKIITSYAYIDAEVSQDNTIPVGNRLYNTPEHGASLWTTYEIQKGKLQGLGFGGGFDFVGERQGDLANSFQVDSYFLTNAAIFYRRDDWRLGLNFKNLFDIDYIAATSNSRTNGNEPGAPFTVIGSVSVQF
jgi:iron complex outermembrane recepter protein